MKNLWFVAFRGKKSVAGTMRCGGFTLLEVLLALAIVAVAATGVLSLTNELFRYMGNARNMDELVLLARDISYKYGRGAVHPVLKDGKCDPPDDDCSWSIRSESTGEQGMALMTITLECSREDNAKIVLESMISSKAGIQ